MTSFVSPDFPSDHGGLARLAKGLAAAQSLASNVNGPKGTASALVAGGLAAAIVVANQIVSAWADGHLLLAWIAMWALVFALLAVFADTFRGLPARLRADLHARKQARRIAADDERTWSAAIADPRLMADLDIARVRAEQEAMDQGLAPPHWPFAKRAAQPHWM